MLFVVAFTAIHVIAGLVLVFLWSFANIVYDMAAKDYQDKKKKDLLADQSNSKSQEILLINIFVSILKTEQGNDNEFFRERIRSVSNNTGLGTTDSKERSQKTMSKLTLEMTS